MVRAYLALINSFSLGYLLDGGLLALLNWETDNLALGPDLVLAALFVWKHLYLSPSAVGRVKRREHAGLFLGSDDSSWLGVGRWR